MTRAACFILTGLALLRTAVAESPAELVAQADAALSTANTEYAAKRTSRRLGPVRAETLPPGTWSDWDTRRQRTRGGPAEQYKHPCLIGDVNFRMTMPVLNAAR